MKNTTRKQLIALGLSKYQASILTKPLTPRGRNGRSATFAISEIIEVIRQRLANKRIRPNTRTALSVTLNLLLERLGNVVPLSQSDNPEIQKAGAKLLRSIARTDAALSDLDATAMEIKAKYAVSP